MKQPSQPRMILGVVILPWYRQVNPVALGLVFLSACFTVFVILCAAKAVR